MENKLSTLDQIFYKTRKDICDDCKNSDDCKQDMKYLMPAIIHDKPNDKYYLSSKRCTKRRGVINAYVPLKTYTNLIENKSREKVLKHLRLGRGGFIFGEPGNGKSYTLAAIANELNKQGHGVYLELANNVAQKIFNFSTRQKELDLIMNADIVLIDDFAGERYMTVNGFDTVFDCWTPIIKTRIDNGKPIYFSSNYSLQQVSEKIGDFTDTMTAKVLCDRISTLGVFEFVDRDYRRN